MAAAKRKANGQALLEQNRDNVMDIEALMNKAPVVRLQVIVLEPRRDKNNKEHQQSIWCPPGPRQTVRRGHGAVFGLVENELLTALSRKSSRAEEEVEVSGIRDHPGV